ncbi:MAG: 6-phosphofructokinase [Marinilabiliaceae bacterium]|nr:6-phosphofructokinase [Marinilabiliaceae bacterium]
MKKIAVLTSGGDAPGMNAAIRAVVRGAISYKLQVMGVFRGYQGLIDDDLHDMTSKSVSNIIHQGGTILKTARCKEFQTKEGRKKAFYNLRKHDIDGLVVIGGNGTFTGAKLLGEEFNFPVIGIPGTIDNDLYGTDFTIGFDTALNTVVDAVDKIRDTATAHNRLFFVEVMGRHAGFLALHSAIASGSEAVFTPEVDGDMERLYDFLRNKFKKAKSSSIVIVAEGTKEGNAITISQKVTEDFPEYDTRVSILGHIQRGGSPSPFDRVLASELGVAAVRALIAGKKAVMMGLESNKLVEVPFDDAIFKKKDLDPRMVGLVGVLSI